jgi:predicted phosphodiesterase
MERTKRQKYPDAILSGDWHLREDVPICRLDNFWDEQWEVVDFIADLQKQYNCPVLNGGDLFNHWKPSPYLLSETMKHLPEQFYCIYGNHDLPQHSIDLSNRCGINVLKEAGKLNLLQGCHWGQIPKDESTNINGKSILVWHVMTFQGTSPYPGCKDAKGATLLRKYPSFSLILTSDNHKPFIETHDGRILVNPGCITRQTASQFDYHPAVWLWFAETNTVQPVYLPISKGIISREHLEEKIERDSRINSFISKLDGDFDAGMSFEDNLQMFESQNSIRKSVMNIVYHSIENNERIYTINIKK